MTFLEPAPRPLPADYEWQLVSTRPHRGRVAIIIAASAFAAIGVAVGVVGLTRPGPTPPATVSQPASTTTNLTADPIKGAHALCLAMAPLFAEDDKKSNEWNATGDPGTPARDAALLAYRVFSEDWAGRAQDILDAHPDADPFLRRTTQRFIDDRVLLVRNMRPGPVKPPDDEAWADSMTAYGGPLWVGQYLGIKW